MISPVDAYDPHAEPEFLTDGERLEVVLGDTVVLPCQLRNLGKTSIQSLFLLIFIVLYVKKKIHQVPIFYLKVIFLSWNFFKL